MVKTDGDALLVTIANPVPYLYLAGTKRRFAALLKETFSKYPSSPDRRWRLIIYNDQCRPGNRPKAGNKRAMETIYMSFCEFRMENLSKEDNWLCVGAVAATARLPGLPCHGAQ